MSLNSSFDNDLKNAFGLFDVNKTGHVSARKLQRCLLNLANNSKSEVSPFIYTILAEVESKATDDISLSLEDFQQLFNSACLDKSTSELFHIFDPSKTGGITIANLREAFRDLGEPYTENELRQMIEYADLNGDGIVSEEEFNKMIIQSRTK